LDVLAGEDIELKAALMGRGEAPARLAARLEQRCCCGAEGWRKEPLAERPLGGVVGELLDDLEAAYVWWADAVGALPEGTRGPFDHVVEGRWLTRFGVVFSRVLASFALSPLMRLSAPSSSLPAHIQRIVDSPRREGSGDRHGVHGGGRPAWPDATDVPFVAHPQAVSSFASRVSVTDVSGGVRPAGPTLVGAGPERRNEYAVAAMASCVGRDIYVEAAKGTGAAAGTKSDPFHDLHVALELASEYLLGAAPLPGVCTVTVHIRGTFMPRKPLVVSTGGTSATERLVLKAWPRTGGEAKPAAVIDGRYMLDDGDGLTKTRRKKPGVLTPAGSNFHAVERGLIELAPGVKHVTIDGLTVRGSLSHGIWAPGDYGTVETN
ncbi:MAG: hypothetical protein D6685_09870, partial [Bacteroidetes bacterium]